MKKSIAVFIALVMVAVGGIVGYVLTKDPQSAAMHDVKAPTPAAAASVREDAAGTSTNVVEFSLRDIDGNMRQLSDWHGKARLVNFWATWCAPCRREIPLLKSTQAAHADKGLQIIGIAVDFQEDVEAYATDAQFNYPILVGQEDAMAAAEASGIEFLGLPFTMIVAPDGELLKTHVGEIFESHIDLIIDVFNGLEDGRLDIAGARSALNEL